MLTKQFGGKITKDWKARYEKSDQWQDGIFQNLEETQSGIDWKKLPGVLCKQIKGHQQGSPSEPLPVLPFQMSAFMKAENGPQFIWYGHSVVLLRWNDKTILIDPMLGDDASPIAPIKTARFSKNTLNIIDDLPEIDLMLITHDHYDHLDLNSIQKLKSKTKKYFVALGVKRHLLSWGVAEDLIQEFDWWDKERFHDLQITFTPTRHFSGRGLSSMAKCLWGGWAFNSNRENIWFSGDSGYGEHFKEIGQTLGSFDFAFMECGQYADEWPQIHMFPDESVQAALDASVKKAMPVHWAGFNLSYQHAWFEPAAQFVEHSQQLALDFCLPRLGELCSIQHQVKNAWW